MKINSFSFSELPRPPIVISTKNSLRIEITVQLRKYQNDLILVRIYKYISSNNNKYELTDRVDMKYREEV